MNGSIKKKPSGIPEGQTRNKMAYQGLLHRRLGHTDAIPATYFRVERSLPVKVNGN
jgi:hypothetical protein